MFLSGSLSIRLLNNCDSKKFQTQQKTRRCLLLLLLRLCENANQKPNCNDGVPSLRVVFFDCRRKSVFPSAISSLQSLQQFGFSSNKRLNPFKMHKFASLCKLQDRLQVITNETNPIGQIKKRNSLRNQIHFEFLQLKNSRTYSRKKEEEQQSRLLTFHSDRSIPEDGEKLKQGTKLFLLRGCLQMKDPQHFRLELRTLNLVPIADQ